MRGTDVTNDQRVKTPWGTDEVTRRKETTLTLRERGLHIPHHGVLERKKGKEESGLVAYACNTNTLGVEVGGLLERRVETPN